MEAPEHVNAPCCEAKPRTAPARSRKPSSGLARIAVLSLTAGMLWLGFLQYRILRAMNTEALMGGGAAALGLDVRPSGSYWRVTWNRSSAYVNGAARGYLRIEDGARRKDVELDASELRNSSVIYDPAGNEISVHLEVFGAEGGRSTAETLHLFAALPPADGRETARTEITPVDRLNAADVVNSGRQARSDSLPIIPEH